MKGNPPRHSEFVYSSVGSATGTTTTNIVFNSQTNVTSTTVILPAIGS
jgi:hypothetical protein